MSVQWRRNRSSVATSIGVPFHSMAAAAFMKRPRNNARGRSMRGSMAGNSRSSASTSLSQYSRIAATSSADHGPPDKMRARHLLLFGDVDPVDPEIGRGAKQAGTVRQRVAVGSRAKFREQVEHVNRRRPVERLEATKFGAGVVGDQHGVGADWERRLALRIPRATAARFVRCAAPSPPCRPAAAARRSVQPLPWWRGRRIQIRNRRPRRA